MGAYVADEVVKLMVQKRIQVTESEVLILGFTFKENCPDVRNTKVIDIVKRLEEYHVNVYIHDPWANPEEVRHEYNIDCHNDGIEQKKFNAVILAVPHKEYLNMDIAVLGCDDCIFYDVKSVLPEALKAVRL